MLRGQAPPDEAKKSGKTAAYFEPPSHDIPNYFHGMDVISVPAAGDPTEFWPDELLDQLAAKPRPARVVADVVSTNSEILGRNTWMMWCGGNEGFWDWLSTKGHGQFDFLKLIDTRNRATRWRDVGMVAEPGMRQSLAADDWGLWLDEPEDPARSDFDKKAAKTLFDWMEDPASRPSSAATTKPVNGYYDDPYDPTGKFPPPNIYGLSSGVAGLRLFPNPNFKGEARKKWDPKRYYDDPAYYGDPNLVRPYRVGMACAFCHVSAHPLNAPLNPASPKWENLSGNIGSQYLRVRIVFGNLLKPDNFIYHVLDSQPPGTIDTSLVATDNINNPNTMNAIFGIPQRAVRSFENPREKLAAPAAAIPSLFSDPSAAPQALKDRLGEKLAQSNDNPRYVPRVLLPGEDSVGALAALARVYLNIGTYWEQWIRLHEPLIGFVHPMANTPEDNENNRVQQPFKIADCEANSVYWQATRQRVEGLRDYFLKVTPTMPLLDARGEDGGNPRVDTTKLLPGRRVYAANCIVCHSSIQPESDVKFAGIPDYATKHANVIKQRKAKIDEWERNGESWDHDPGQWLRQPEYHAWAVDVVEQPEFWRQNFLSTDARVPVNYVGTNSARSMATNATDGHMWEDFSSDTFRNLPSVGAIPYFNPFNQQDELYTPRHRNLGNAPAGGGGPGFYRPASLMTVWATAPLLHNNSLGHFNNDPSVNGRLSAFDDAIHKLLYPERRLLNSDYATPAQLAHDHGLIWRTQTDTYLQVRGTEVPLFLRRMPLPASVFSFSEWLTETFGGWVATPSLVFLTVAFLILFFARRGSRKWRRARLGAYFLIVLALLAGFVAYLDTGGFGDLRVGPIPAGTPVNLLDDINPEAPPDQIRKALKATLDGLTEIQTSQLTGEARDKVFRDKIAPALLSVSKCPDMVMDKGHYFPWFADMSSDDKEALIELLKTF